MIGVARACVSALKGGGSGGDGGYTDGTLAGASGSNMTLSELNMVATPNTQGATSYAYSTPVMAGSVYFEIFVSSLWYYTTEIFFMGDSNLGPYVFPALGTYGISYSSTSGLVEVRDSAGTVVYSGSVSGDTIFRLKGGKYNSTQFFRLNVGDNPFALTPVYL